MSCESINWSHFWPQIKPEEEISEFWCFPVACFGNPDPVGMKVYCPEGKETFDDDETTEEAPS